MGTETDVPMNPARVFKKTQCDAVYGGVTPTLVEKATGAIQVVEIVLVGLTSPKVHVSNLEVAPEVTGRVAVCLPSVIRPSDVVSQPVHGVVLMDVLGVLGYELEGLGPESRNRFGGVVEVDGKAIGLVVVLHEAEDVVIDIAEKVNLGLDTPIVLHIGEGGMFVK